MSIAVCELQNIVIIRYCRTFVVFCSATFNSSEILHISASNIFIFFSNLVFLLRISAKLFIFSCHCRFAPFLSSLNISHYSIKSAISLSAKFIALFSFAKISIPEKIYTCTVKIDSVSSVESILDATETIRSRYWP